MILIYLVFFFLVLRFTVTVFNFISNPKLTRSLREYDDLVSILIPARNEEENILNLLESIKEQDYQHYEVIVLNDNSSDNTLALCRIFCNTDSRFQVLQGKALPEDWLGKNFACFQLANAAKGKYLMFLDADEVIADGLINSSIHRMKLKGLSLLTLFTNQVMVSLGERMVVPLMHYMLLNLLPLRLVSLSKSPAFSTASGQFMLFDANNYMEHQWHEQVKNTVVEDIEIMKLIKGFGYKGEALLANGFISSRMYTNLKEAMDGFGRNLLASFNNSVPGLFLYIFLVILGPIAMLGILSTELLLFALSLILLSRVMISLMAGQKIWANIVLHPLQLFCLVIIAVVSVKRHFTHTLVWKGRNIRNGA